MTDPNQTNQENWNQLAESHFRSEFYNVASFKAGKLTLNSLEIQELGDVRGKSLLHLQCHFGMDTLSWSSLGARVTGVDYAENAIHLARQLSQETGLPGTFICSSVYDLPTVLDEKFDIVFTSGGVLCWLNDLKRWGEVIFHCLKPGGVFYIVEIHPFASIFRNEKDVTGLEVTYPYFFNPIPENYEAEGSYATSESIHYTAYEWAHPLSEIIQALLIPGLKLEFLHEFPFAGYQHFPFLVQGEDGFWRLPQHAESLPMLFSMKATRPA